MGYGQNEYGQLMYIEDSNAPLTVEVLIPDLMRYLPDYYTGVAHVKDIEVAIAKRFGKVKFDVEDVLSQLFVNTATWGLTWWETFLGLTVDPTKSNEFRREAIKAKIRGAGTTTKSMIKNTASSFSGGDVDIIEYTAQNKFVIKFTGTRGIPSNMQDLTAAIEEIKPAHLEFDFEYTYTVWNFIQDGRTWNSLTTYTWDRLRVI